MCSSDLSKSNHSILLGKAKKGPAETAISNHKEIMELLIGISEIDFTILRYHNDKLKDKK